MCYYGHHKIKVTIKKPLVIVVDAETHEEAQEGRVRLDLVESGGALEQLDLLEDLKLLATLLEVDQPAVGRVAERRVDHGEVREEGAEVRKCALDHLRVRLRNAQNYL